MDALASEQDRQVKKLKRKLEGWREAILPLHSVLTWDKRWYPAAIFAVVSFAYGLLWLSEPPLLALCALAGIAVTLADFLVPSLMSGFFAASAWTKNEEKLYEEICKSAVIHYGYFFITWQSFFRMRETAPRMYYALLIASLTVTTWFGLTVNNLFLSYLFTLFAFLTPGLLTNETFSTYFMQALHAFTSFIKSYDKSE